MAPLFKCEDLIKIFPQPRGIETFATLRGITFEANRGDFIIIIGPSGCGKSTLLNLIMGFDRPSAGSIYLNNKSILEMNQKRLTEYRRKFLGFVHQNPRNNVIWNLNVQDNLKFQILMQNSDYDRNMMEEKSLQYLEFFNLFLKAKARIHQLSGGELQRIGLIIALLNKPPLLILDEPTSQLDYSNSLKVIKYLKNLSEEENKSVIMVSHDWKLVKYSTRLFLMENGLLLEKT